MRRIPLFLNESLYDALQWVVFEPNADQTNAFEIVVNTSIRFSPSV